MDTAHRPGSRPTGHCLRGPTRLLLALAAVLMPSAAAAQFGAISGTVTNASSGFPLTNVSVAAIDARGAFSVYASSSGSGAYVIPNLPPGQYFVYTSTPGPFVNEVLPDTPCPYTCSGSLALSLGQPLIVSAGLTRTGVNFALNVGGRIRGTITASASGSPLADVDVHAYTRIGASILWAGSATSNSLGVYIIDGLAAGDYLLYTSGATTLGLVNEVFDDVQCPGLCRPDAAFDTGTQVPVSLLSTTSGRDFALEPGGGISGAITDAASGVPIPNLQVNVYALVGWEAWFAGAVLSNASGVYTLQGLPDGRYYAYTGNTLGYINEIFDDLQCPINCLWPTAVESGAEIIVRAGVVTSGRDFALDRGGAISGTVTNAATAAPIPSAAVFVVVRNGNAFYSSYAFTNAAGAYTMSGLPTGVYRAYVSASTFVKEIYGNIPCVGTCPLADVWAAGAPISVTAGAATLGRDFALEPGATITGTVADELTSFPIAYAAVSVIANVGGTPTVVHTGPTDSAGVYQAAGLPAGTYGLVADVTGYQSEVYDGIACLGTSCAPAEVLAGTPVAVTTGTTSTGRNFALRQRGLIFGQVVDGLTGAGLANVTVSVYNRATGELAGSASANAAGYYRVANLPNGSYVACTSNASGYFNEIFAGIRCAESCSSTAATATGSPISVIGTGGTGGIDFALDLRNSAPAVPGNLRAEGSAFTVTFRWSAPSTEFATGATSYVLEAGLSPGGTIASFPVTDTSFTVAGVPAGTFYVRVRGVNAFGSGPATPDYVLRVGTDGLLPLEAPTSLAAVMNGGRLTLTWGAPETGGPPTGYLVEAGSATGLADLVTLPVNARSFTFGSVPPGYYFLRVRAHTATRIGPHSGEAMIVVGNVASPPGPPFITSHSVDGSTVTLNWSAPAFGTATRFIIEAGSARGLSDLAVFNTGNANVTLVVPTVPPGTYYVRIRAVNARGASVVSNERTIVVGS